MQAPCLLRGRLVAQGPTVAQTSPGCHISCMAWRLCTELCNTMLKCHVDTVWPGLPAFGCSTLRLNLVQSRRTEISDCWLWQDTISKSVSC